ncbi:hypothetical protein JCM16814_34580 [Desulfobaculum senezii]
MTKYTPHHDLNQVKDLVERDEYTLTRSAKRRCREEVGIDPDEALPQVIAQLSRRNFIKSESDYYRQGEWQDAYHLLFEGSDLYVKFKLTTSNDNIILVTSLHLYLED